MPPGAWMFVCCECCVLSGRGLCDELITLLEESCRMWCVVVCDLETSGMRRAWPTGGCRATHPPPNKQNMIQNIYWFLCTVYVIIVNFYSNFNFLTDFGKTIEYKISRKSAKWEPICSVRMVCRTDRHEEANSRFWKFANPPKSES